MAHGGQGGVSSRPHVPKFERPAMGRCDCMLFPSESDLYFSPGGNRNQRIQSSGATAAGMGRGTQTDSIENQLHLGKKNSWGGLDVAMNKAGRDHSRREGGERCPRSGDDNTGL